MRTASTSNAANTPALPPVNADPTATAGATGTAGTAGTGSSLAQPGGALAGLASRTTARRDPASQTVARRSNAVLPQRSALALEAQPGPGTAPPRTAGVLASAERTIRDIPGGGATLDGAKLVYEDVIGSHLPSARQLGATCGHAVQQALTCAVPTMAREMVLPLVFHALAESKAPPWALVGAQTAIAAAGVAANMFSRAPRMARDEDAAVKGHFGLDDAAIIPADDSRRADVRQNGRQITLHLAFAELAMLGMSAAGAAGGDKTMAARAIAIQARNITYLSRDALSAAVRFVGSEGHATHGIGEGDMGKMAMAYSLATMASSAISGALLQSKLQAHLGASVDGAALIDTASVERLNGQSLLAAAALVAGVRAGFNTLVEMADSSLGKSAESKQAGGQTQQVWNPGDKLPLGDFDRLQDHSAIRYAWNQGGSIGGVVFEQAAKAMDLSPQLTAVLGAAAQGALFGLPYQMINQGYQACARVRGAMKQQQQQPTSTAPVTVTPQAPQARRLAVTPNAQAGPSSLEPNAAARPAPSQSFEMKPLPALPQQLAGPQAPAQTSTPTPIAENTQLPPSRPSTPADIPLPPSRSATPPP